MAQLSSEEKAFYKRLYTIVNDQTINEALVKYATIQYNTALSKLKRLLLKPLKILSLSFTKWK
jgi:hypothetical protein